MVAEKLFLGDATVYVKEKRILVEGYLGRYAQDHVLLYERLTVHFVVRQLALDPAAYHILKLLQISW